MIEYTKSPVIGCSYYETSYNHSEMENVKLAYVTSATCYGGKSIAKYYTMQYFIVKKMNTNEIIELILKNEEKKAGTFAKEIGVTPTQIYDLQSGKIKRISEGIANKILLVYPQYDKAWLLSGEGEPIKKKAEDEASPKIIEFENFPLVTQKAYAGYLSGWADEEYVESLPTSINSSTILLRIAFHLAPLPAPYSIG